MNGQQQDILSRRTVRAPSSGVIGPLAVLVFAGIIAIVVTMFIHPVPNIRHGVTLAPISPPSITGPGGG
jgi:hypothetical protein